MLTARAAFASYKNGNIRWINGRTIFYVPLYCVTVFDETKRGTTSIINDNMFRIPIRNGFMSHKVQRYVHKTSLKAVKVAKNGKLILKLNN